MATVKPGDPSHGCNANRASKERKHELKIDGETKLSGRTADGQVAEDT